jgi:isocitrate dehydrogenase
MLAAVMLLQHVGRSRAAETLHNAWLRTLEDGVHTADLWQEGLSRERVDTRAFGRAVFARLGQEPTRLAPVRYPDTAPHARPKAAVAKAFVDSDQKSFDGVDVFLHWDEAGRSAQRLAERAQTAADSFKLSLITNRGVRVWPQGHPDTWCSDHWRLRFRFENARAVPALLSRLIDAGLEPVKTENLYRFGEQRGYSLAQGE